MDDKRMISITTHNTVINCYRTISPLLSNLSGDKIIINTYPLEDMLSYASFLNTGTILPTDRFNPDLYMYMGHKQHVCIEYWKVRLMEEWNNKIIIDGLNGLYKINNAPNYTIGNELSQLLYGLYYSVVVPDMGNVHKIIVFTVKTYDILIERLHDIRSGMYYHGHRSLITSMDGREYEILISQSVAIYSHTSSPCTIYYGEHVLRSLISDYVNSHTVTYLSCIFDEYVTGNETLDGSLQLTWSNNIRMYPYYNMYPRCSKVLQHKDNNGIIHITSKDRNVSLTKIDILYTITRLSSKYKTIIYRM